MSNDVSLGLAHEAEVMLRKVGATRENFWVPISKDEELARRVVEVVNSTSVRITVSPNIPFEYEGCWSLISDVEFKEGELFLEPADFLDEGEECISGDKLVKRAQDMKVLFGQRHAEALVCNQDQIPKEWRRYRFPFPGTIRQHLSGGRGLPLLQWTGVCWRVDFMWLSHFFGADDRLVRARKSA